MLPHRTNPPLKAAGIVNPGVNPGVNPDVNPFLRHSGFPERGFFPGGPGLGMLPKQTERLGRDIPSRSTLA